MLPPLNDTDENRFQTILRDTHSAVRSYLAGLGVPTASVDELATRCFLELPIVVYFNKHDLFKRKIVLSAMGEYIKGAPTERDEEVAIKFLKR